MADQYPHVKYIQLPRRDGWMVTLTDMTYVLMTFFVLILSMSAMDKKAFKESFGFFNEGSGVLEYPGEQQLRSMSSPADKNVLKIVDMSTLSRELQANVPQGIPSEAGNVGTDLYDVRSTPRGLAIALNSDVLFDTGSARIKPQMQQAMSGIAAVLARTDGRISVEGHTDNTGETEMNMNLSLRRGQAVLDYFIYVADMRPTRFCLAGYGPFMPFWHNDTELGRARNRRVEIVLLKDHI
jgi:chemotaxis protein MotB